MRRLGGVLGVVVLLVACGGSSGGGGGSAGDAGGGGSSGGGGTEGGASSSSGGTGDGGGASSSGGPSDGGGTGEGGGGEGGAGACGGDTLVVCQTPSACTTSGVATLSYGCCGGAATTVNGLTTVVFSTGKTTNDLFLVTIPGVPKVGTYSTASVGTLPSKPSALYGAAVCHQAGTNNANKWIMREAAPGVTAVGTFTMTLTSVQTGQGQDAADGYYVEGTVHLDCEPDPTTAAKGTVTVDAKF